MPVNRGFVGLLALAVLVWGVAFAGGITVAVLTSSTNVTTTFDTVDDLTPIDESVGGGPAAATVPVANGTNETGSPGNTTAPPGRNTTAPPGNVTVPPDNAAVPPGNDSSSPPSEPVATGSAPATDETDPLTGSAPATDEATPPNDETPPPGEDEPKPPERASDPSAGEPATTGNATAESGPRRTADALGAASVAARRPANLPTRSAGEP